MAELTPRERLQPSLLDRLTDDEPQQGSEPRDRRVLSMRALRQGVLRDLAWLLNTTAMSALQDLSDFPHVARSVLNYGLPDTTGKTASGLDHTELERHLRDAICTFEPRILRNSVQVKAVSAAADGQHNRLVFELQGELWAQPVPERLFLRTELDLEMGKIVVSDYTQSGARA
jgi:type VI secretion system protein ImpF